MSLDITIDAKEYSLVPDRDNNKVVTRPVQQFVQSQKTTGRTRPEDVANYESFIIPNLMKGFGRARINSDVAFDPKEYRRFFDSTSDTRWADRIYLPILSESATSTNLDIGRGSATLGAETNAIFDSDGRVVNRQFTGSSTDAWENGGTVNPVIFNTHVADGVTIGAGGTRTISFSTAGAGSALLVFFAVTNPGSPGTGMITMTYNSVALSMATNGNTNLHTYYLMSDAPAAGANNLVITNSSGSTAIQDGIIVIVNILTTSTGNFFGSSNPATEGDENDDSVTLTGTTSGRLVVGATFTDQGGLMSPGSGVTEHATFEDSEGSGKNSIIFGSIQATGSSTTFSATAAGSGHEQTVAIEMIGSGSGEISASVGLDMISHKGKLIALVAEEDDHKTYYSDDGVSWSRTGTPITAGLLTNNVATDEDIDAGLLAEIGGELIALVWHESNGTITAFSSTNGGTTFSDESNFDIASGNGPQGVATYQDIDGSNKLYVGTAEGLYIVDTSTANWTFELVFPMPYSTDNCRQMTVHEGALWFAQGVDDDSPAPIYRLTVQGNSRIIESNYGLSFGDGVPDNLLGPVRQMVSSGDQLFISVGGGKAGRNARVLAWNGEGWHHMTKNGTANQKIDFLALGTGDDSVPRLHYGIRTSASASSFKFLEQPLVNPRSGVEIKREDTGTHTGTISLPDFDLGIPHEAKAFLAAHVSADYPSTDEKVEFYFGLDGADRDTDLGDFTSTVSKLEFGSKAGVSGKNIGIDLKLDRGSTNTRTPSIRDITLEGYVVPELAQEHRMTIDLKQTAQETGQPIETVISNLETLLGSVVQKEFKFGQVSKFVAIDRERSTFNFGIDAWEASGAPNALSERNGTFNLVLIEKIAY